MNAVSPWKYNLKIDCFDCGVTYSGKNVGNPLDPFDGDAEDCRKKCEITMGCNFFTWRKWNSRNVCVLKAKAGKMVSKSNAISGAKSTCQNGGIVDIFCY